MMGRGSLDFSYQRSVLKDSQSISMPQRTDIEDAFDIEMLMLDGCNHFLQISSCREY